ncbi:MAG: alpha/beta fold hydrolase [Cyanobacteria bacterium P01_D01_bin.105]
MTSWLICPQHQLRPRLRLFCFSYAGGSAWMFRAWANQLPETVEVFAIELPGRGKRLVEPALSDLGEIVRMLGPQLLPHLNLPFAFFGHSMGALVAFELAQRLRRSMQLTPVHFWASAARAPHLPVPLPLMHTLDDATLMNKLKQYEGTPTSVISNVELMELLLPTLRADFAVLETYRYRPSAPFLFPITGLWGETDRIVSKLDVAAWQSYTPKFTLQAIAGNHFFIHQPLFAQTLMPTLKPLIS